MPFVNAGRNLMLDALTAAADYVSLHTADPTSGANEASGGSPAYARKAVTHAAAASGVAAQNGTDPVFDVPAGTYYAIGYWSAVSAGTFYAWSPLAGESALPFYAANTNDKFTVDNHGYVADDRVYLYAIAGSTFPTGAVEGVAYWIVAVSGDTFKVSLTQSGSAVVLSSDGGGAVQRFTPAVLGAQGTVTVDTGSLTLTG